jgi:hypothetical protein
MHTKFRQQHCTVSRPKNLAFWWDLNPVSSVLEADAMTIMPRRQGSFSIFLPQLRVFINVG